MNASTLVYLVSEQAWPCILSVADAAPGRLILLHSTNPERSKSPAQRLKRFFDRVGWMSKGMVQLEEISDTDIHAIERSLDALRLDLGATLVNFTGGNKLMSLAAARWAARRGVPSCYLERNGKLYAFEPRDGEIHSKDARTINASKTNDLDPLLVVRCQFGSGEIERDGQLLTLHNGELQIEGQADRTQKEGDKLEFETAHAVLELGVRSVRRSVRLKVKSQSGTSSRKPVAELDLLFIHDGKLWLIDCKDSIRHEWMADGLKPYLNLGDPKAVQLWEDVRKALAISQTKALKEDFLHAREIAGLVGQAVAVRRNLPDEEIRQFAKDHHIDLIETKHLKRDLERMLFPHRPATDSALSELKAAFK